MINNTKIQSCFNGLVGWRESSKAPICYPNLSNSITTSNSGLYVNDIPGITLNLLNDVLGKDETSIDNYLTNLHNSSSIELINDFIINQKSKINTKSLLSNFVTGIKLTDIRKTNQKRWFE